MKSARAIGVVALSAIAFCGALAPSTTAHAEVSPSQATAFQGSATHDGAGPADGKLSAPLDQSWQRSFGGNVSYPVIAGNLAYVTVGNGTYNGTWLYALDLSSGQTVWGPIDLGGSTEFSAVTYESGRVFALNYSGVLRAFDAATGSGLWTMQLPGQYAFTSPPTASNGIVYTGGSGNGGTVYAVDASNGSLLWTARVANGDDSSPAVTASGVYVSYACDQAYDFDPATGAQLWHHDSWCSGGGGKTVAVHNGRVYTRDHAGNLILDANSGALLGSYSATTVPAFDGTTGYFLNGTSLNALDQNGTLRWSFTGDGALSSAPIVYNGYVYVGSKKGHIYGLDGSTGALAWSATVAQPIQAPDEQNAVALTGLAAANGTLLVPASSTLTAFGPAKPKIVATASGTTGDNGWFQSRVTVHFTCTAGSYPLATCPPDVTLKQQGADQLVSGVTTDVTGQSASTSIVVNIDWTPPSVAITSTATLINSRVQGTATDHVSGVGSVIVTFTGVGTGTTMTEEATLVPCGGGDPNCVQWSAPPPTSTLGAGPTAWTGTVTATATDVAGLNTTTSPTQQTLLG